VIELLDPVFINFLIRIFGRESIHNVVDPTKISLKTYLVPIDIIKPHEGFYNNLVSEVLEQIISWGYLKYPIIVDSRTMIVLDGHHRLEALKRLGLKYIPVFFIDYAESYVDLYPIRKEIPVSKIDVVKKVYVENSIYPPKTTRHFYIGISILPSYIPLKHLINENLSYLPILRDF